MMIHEAAKTIGCIDRWVRTLAQRGEIKARRIPYTAGPLGYRWDLDACSVRAYRDRKFQAGRPRKFKPGEGR